ncbi:MAG: DUF89 family protein [Spirochaetales bacterium]|nr:DUF89 family protein [Spirochaetales bacterium]
MKTYRECVPCFVLQAREACRLLGLNDEKTREIDEAARMLLGGIDRSTPPPMTSRRLCALVAGKSGRRDPYRELKRESNEAALAAYPRVKEMVAGAAHPLRAAVIAAGAGNIIDFGALRRLNLADGIDAVFRRVEAASEARDGISFEFDSFEKAIGSARRLLYLLDNAGEAVFDRVLIEELKTSYPGLEMTFAVRGAPVINDCLEEDAVACGLGALGTIVSNGSDAPGTVLPLCSADFRGVWEKSDLVIGKGQGNYESLSGVPKNVFFLLIVKCRVVARHIGARVRDIVLKRE